MTTHTTSDPTSIDWAPRQARAAVPFRVVAGRPVNPAAPTGRRRGRGGLWHWGEQQAADAIVTARHIGAQWILLIERRDGHGWAIPGGMIDPGETPLAAAIRELGEETGLELPNAPWRLLPARVVPDPRATDEAWVVTTPAVVDLGDVTTLPAVAGADDARRADWVPAISYPTLRGYLAAAHGGQIFAAHRAMLAELLG